MRLSSPANQLVSLHPDPSIVGSIEDIKAAAGFAQGVHLYSMASPLEKGHRDPRSSYSTAFYPDPKLLAYSSPKTAASRAIPRIQSNQTQSGDEAISDGEATRSSVGARKRKLSWPPSDKAHMEYKSVSPSDRRISGPKEEEADFKDVQMNPPSQSATSSGLVASERLPGIAHFDEQMNSPWSIEAARRNANFRSSGGEESLRRLSGQTFNSPAEGRPWRFSMQESSIQLPHPGEYHSPSQGPDTFRRPSSPSANRYYQRGGGNSVDRMMVYRGASPSMDGGSALYSRQHGVDRDISPSHRPPMREWNEGAPQLPIAKSQLEDRRRHSTMLGGFGSGSRDHLNSNERAPLDRRGMDLGSGTSTPTFGSVAMHSRQSESTLPSMQSSLSYDSQNGPGGLERNSFDSRSYERGDSPSYYAEDGRIDESSPRHHPYGLSGAGASPNAPRRRGKLPKAVTDLLKSWLLDHSSHPYPTEDEKRRLCSVTGLSISQVSNWFINARRRILVPQGSGSFGIGPPQQIGPGHEGSMGGPPRHPGPPMHHQHGPPPPHHLASRYSPPISSNHQQSPHYSMQQPYQHHRAPPAHLPPLHQLHSRSSHPAPFQHHQHPFERPVTNQHEEAESHLPSSHAYSKRESSQSPRNTSGPSFAEGQGQ